jgi:hypothetical protein
MQVTNDERKDCRKICPLCLRYENDCGVEVYVVRHETDRFLLNIFDVKAHSFNEAKNIGYSPIEFVKTDVMRLSDVTANVPKIELSPRPRNSQKRKQ